MPVTAIIPIVEDYREVILPAGYADQIRHSLIVGDYLYYFCGFPLGQMLKINKNDFTDRAVLTFPNDGKHRVPLEMCHVGGILYCLFRNVDTNDVPSFRFTIGRVQTDPFAILSDFVDVSATYIVQNGSITTDGTSLYVIAGTATLYATRKILKYAISGGAPTVADVTGFGSCHCVRYSGGKLYLTGWDFPANAHVARMTTALAIEQSIDFEAADGEFYENEFGISTDHIWVSDRSLRGIVKKFQKSNLTIVTDLPTGQLARSTQMTNDGRDLWVLFENGRSVRFNPSSNAQAIYALNDGQGYQSELLGDGTYVWAGWNQDATKIARYHIPPDVAPGHINWLTQTSFDRAAPPVAVKFLSDGSVVTAGRFSQTVDFGNGVTLTSQLGTDGYVAKYNPSGVAQWARRITGASTPQEAVSLAVDANDNIFALGFYLSFTVKVGVEEIVVTNTNQTIASRDCWLAKFTSDGACTWARGFGSVGYDNPGAIQVDSAGDIFVATELANTVNFGNGVTITSPTGFMNLVKFRGADGVALWAFNQNFGTANSIIMDGNDPIVAGNFYLKKFSGVDGSAVWSAPLTGLGKCKGVARAIAGNIVICGNANSGANFGGGAISANEIFIAGYNSSGAYQWHKTIGGGSDTANAVGISADSPGILGVTGYLQLVAPAFFVSSYVLSANGATEPTLRWTKAGGLVASSAGYGVALNQNNLVLAAEACSGTVDFGGQTARGSGSIGFGAAAIVNYVR